MNNKISRNWAFFLVFLFACSDMNKPADHYLAISSNLLTFWPEGGSKSITVNTTRDFSVISGISWCTTEILTALKDNLKVVVSANDVIGKERMDELTILSDGLEEKLVVKQLAVEPSLKVKETSVVINEKEGLDFTLTVTSNISVVFHLPAWIHETSGSTPSIGEKTHSFTASALSGGETSRLGEITVEAADSDYANSLTISVKQNREYCMLRIASYNILGGGWTATRAAMVNNIVRQYDFDIFGEQEGTSAQLKDMTTGTGYSYIGDGRDYGGAGEHNSIVYKTNRFQVLEQGKFWYSQTPEVPSRGWDALGYNRICIWGKFKDLVSGREFFVFNSHFDHQGPTARLESAKMLLSRIKSIAGSYPVFATGDFNCNPESEPIRLLLYEGLLKDSYVLTEQQPYGSLGTFNGHRDALPTSRIDYILVTKDIRVKEYGVINDRPNGQFPSDHDPVIAVVEF